MIWSIVWDQYTSTNINKLERIQRQPAIFITGDKSREVGYVFNTLTMQTETTSQTDETLKPEANISVRGGPGAGFSVLWNKTI